MTLTIAQKLIGQSAAFLGVIGDILDAEIHEGRVCFILWGLTKYRVDSIHYHGTDERGFHIFEDRQPEVKMNEKGQLALF